MEKPSKSINFRPLVVVFLALLMGLAFARKLYMGDGAIIALTVIIFVMLLLHSFLSGKYVALLLAVLFFFGGNGLYFLSYSAFMGKEYSQAQISGRVSYVDDDGLLKLTLEDVTANGEKVSGVVLTVLGAPENFFSQGDIVVYKGNLEHQKMFELGDFNYYSYRNSVAYQSEITYKSLNVTSSPLHFDEKARAKLRSLLNENMDDKYASAAYAVLCGDKGELDGELKGDFQSAGIIHLLTVSGLHVTFLATILTFLMKKCKINRFVSIIILFLTLIFYAFICGFTPSIIRAVIMGMVLSIAMVLGREYDGLTALATAGILSLVIFPLSAMDIGFLMSYFSVGMIFLLHRPLKRVLSKCLNGKIASLLALSIAAEMGILPFLATFASSFNLLTFFANLIAVPLFSILFPLLIFFSIISLIIPAAGVILKGCEWGFIALEGVAKFFSSPGMAVDLKPIDPIFTATLFVMAFIVSSYFMIEKLKKWKIIAFLSIFLCFYTLFPSIIVKNESFVAVVDDCMIVQTESGKRLCVGYDYYSLSEFLRYENISQIDYLLAPQDEQKGYYGSKTLLEASGYADEIEYISEGGIFTLRFDGKQILFTNLPSTGYNNSKVEEKLIAGGYDFAFIRSYSGPQPEGCTLLTRQDIKEGGSVKYDLKSKVLRRID